MKFFCTKPMITSLLVLAAPCLAHAQSEGQTVIGTFTGSLDTGPFELHSIYDVDNDYSDLTFSESFGFRTYRVSASMDGKLPILEVTLQEGSVVGDLKVISITLIDTNYESALAAVQQVTTGVIVESYGSISADSTTLGSDGAISFAISADLVRIDLEAETAIPNEPGMRIEGQFSGAIPASELYE